MLRIHKLFVEYARYNRDLPTGAVTPVCAAVLCRLHITWASCAFLQTFFQLVNTNIEFLAHYAVVRCARSFPVLSYPPFITSAGVQLMPGFTQMCPSVSMHNSSAPFPPPVSYTAQRRCGGHHVPCLNRCGTRHPCGSGSDAKPIAASAGAQVPLYGAAL